ncbi:MAG: DUF4276 family protein [Bacteroidia bacterium]|jgi:hypothetical protein|nr:DUF4276 family protein [Bacteroidia bacterium]
MVKANPTIYLLIEGESAKFAASLKEAFTLLLKQVCDGKNPRIVMGDGKVTCIDLFLNTKQYNSPNSQLLVDLDTTSEYRDNDLAKNGLTSRRERVHYMIQEMESWFLSQPEIINEYYKTTKADEFKNKNIESISEPDKVIHNIAQKSNHKTRVGYHKVRDAAALLLKLDAQKLMHSFPDFKNLVNNINNA